MSLSQKVVETAPTLERKSIPLLQLKDSMANIFCHAKSLLGQAFKRTINTDLQRMKKAKCL